VGQDDREDRLVDFTLAFTEAVLCRIPLV